MEDTALYNKISKGLLEACEKKGIKRVNQFCIVVDHSSRITRRNLYEHLKVETPKLIGDWSNIEVRRDEIQSLTAIIHSIEGEK